MRLADARCWGYNGRGPDVIEVVELTAFAFYVSNAS